MKKDRKKSLATLIRIIKSTGVIKGWLVISSLVSIISVTIALVAPQILGIITEEIYDFWAEGIEIDMSRIVYLSFALGGIYILSSLCDLGVMYIMNNVVSRQFTANLRISISEKIKRLPVEFVDKTPVGEVISRMMNDVSTLGNTVHNFLNILISGVIKLTGITVLIFIINPYMAAAIVIFIPLSLLLSSWLASLSEKHFNSARKINGDIYSLMEEDFTGFDTIKAFNLEESQKIKQEELCDKLREKQERGYFLAGVVQPIIALTNNIAYIAICIIGGYLALEGRTTVGDIVVLIVYSKQFAGPLESIANGLSMMQNTIASANRVYNLLDREEMTEEITRKLPDANGEIVFEDVAFSYDKDKPLIKNLNFTVKPGQKVAIVGPTGGGKTTIVNLLMRFYEIDGGRILIDGVDIAALNRADLRSLFSMVLQDTWLFSGSIFENIAYGMENATKEEVIRAAKQAHIDYFINTLPEGYETIINEESSNISSGQKQLLTIARAYLSNRRILILDEATSNVDTRTEILIQNTMDKLMKNRTSFVIAHRLSTIVDADIILVVRDGSIVEQGTHEELLHRNGFYTEIYNSQYDLLTS
ncbi:ABC transporter ATP-binding protein [Alloiococcus sp. CFN-8]|uniref:ABC transporter ATP-binding protein n=1 Tax=Alloiococcus sp. CFN-8 TaxID=3416081 RepID=UPI003CF61B64